MRYFLLSLIVVSLLFLSTVVPCFAVENPLSVPNNKVGIHILFPDELDAASRLVNSGGGDWGYVVVPIQSGDKNLVKWQTFMDNAKRLHIIPIIRLATEGDYFNTRVWRKPVNSDVLDFANFLNSLHWPTKNRYIIVYNEVNRGDEWGGTPNPGEYADILSYGVTAFKSKSNDFFIISAGMDNAAATTAIAMNEYDFLKGMNNQVSGIFNQIDGLASHSYPNPAFSMPPSFISKTSIASFQFEKNLVDSLSTKNLPVFITETGWAQDIVGESTAASFLATALQTVWNTDTVVMVSPFLLRAGGGPFTPFSFFSQSGQENEVYKAVSSLSKVKGAPVVNPESVLAAQTRDASLPNEYFQQVKITSFALQFESNVKNAVKWFLRID